jgi:tetratricopeptide (TPR) repeat protein
MSFRKILLLPLAAAAILRAQVPLNRSVPLLSSAAAPSAGENELSRVAAQRAQELGFPALASDLYRELLKAEPAGADRADRADLTLALATALLDDNRAADAEQALRDVAGPHGATWHLREGLAAARQGRFDQARVESAAVRTGDLKPDDRPWYFFLQGLLAGAAGNSLQAGDLYSQAERAATTDLSRARFFLAQEEEAMRLGPVTDDVAEQTRRTAEQYQGTSVGYEFERSYAVMLAGLGRKSAAIEELQRSLLGLPVTERRRADDFRLLIGLIGGAGDGAGRMALMQLLASGSDPERQRVALELLRQASQREPERSSFRAELSQLIASPSPHPILDDLLFFRADLELGDRPPDYAQAEADARELLNKFPGSPLKTSALGVLTASAWEQLRYRTAALYADQARKEMPAGETRAEFGVLVAEAWFRAGDFRGAAGAYAAALHERPSNVAAGDLIFQRVEAEIEAGSLPAAQTVLDQLASDRTFDAADRWRAEWNMARALGLGGQTGAAYARVNQLLATGSLPASPGSTDLRARLAWLQAQLAFAAHEYARTLDLTAALDGHLAGVSAKLQSDIPSTDALLEAQAYFALNREADGLKTLEQLRRDFPNTDAAVHSYLIAADHYAQQDNSVEAQRLLTTLAQDYPKSTDAPLALYKAALEAEHRGPQAENLQEAVRLIESLVTKYPDSDLVFYGRRKQGDLLRTLNELPQAQEAYESLRNDPRYSRRPDIVYVLLALAECDDAQSASDLGHAESARALFEDLRDRVDAPAEVRIEAGFNLGHFLAQRDHVDEALIIWWRDVVTPFLLDPKAAPLGAKGRFWMTKTLIELGERYAGQGRQEQAKKMWRMILEAKLPGAELAEEDIARLSTAPLKP